MDDATRPGPSSQKGDLALGCQILPFAVIQDLEGLCRALLELETLSGKSHRNAAGPKFFQVGKCGGVIQEIQGIVG